MSFGRHYTLSFATALRAVRRGADTELRVDGDATVARSLGRTWSTFLGYRRDTTYVLGLGDPLFTDAVTTGVGGQVAPRLHVAAGAAYMKGVGAFSLSDGHVTSRSASTKLTLAVTKNVGLYGQYSYYRYGVPDGYFSGFQFAPDFDRRSASVGLSFWVPIINPRPVRRP